MSSRKQDIIEDRDARVMARIDHEISRLRDGGSVFYFFTMDAKNAHNSEIEYIYRIAKSMKDQGYNVKMLYQLENEISDRRKRKQKEHDIYNPMDDNVFCGVGGWLGEEFMEIEHVNIAKVNDIAVAPSDFLFIPEAFSSLMLQTSGGKLPCKRYAVLYNFDYVTDFIPLGSQWASFGITDCIASTDLQAKKIKSVMPYVSAKVLTPCISDEFHEPDKAKSLIVNIISKEKDDVDKIVKMFYWKYPVYKFVSFRDLRGMSKEGYRQALMDGCITVWCDERTPFGHGALESLKCGDVVIGKVPADIQEWMKTGNGAITDGVLWFYSFDDLSDIIASTVNAWMNDDIPQSVYKNGMDIVKKYPGSEWDGKVRSLVEGIVADRIGEFEEIKKNKKEQQEK